MKSKIIILQIMTILFINGELAESANATKRKKMTCGIDKSPLSMVYEGIAKIETYPWLGRLFYPVGDKRLTTAVILISKQIALGAAADIDKYPKKNFRALSKVVLGHNCSGPKLGIMEYAFHPDYASNTYSTLAIIQLDVEFYEHELRPICAPPPVLKDPQFYAMTLSDKCNSVVNIHKMMYVDQDQCKQYYRKSGLDIDAFWPSHTACARSLSGGDCVWRNGAALVLKQNERWHLLGFGVNGPGCEAPARFLDYGMYHDWIKRSIARIGKAAITRMAPDYVILRRMISNVQRFGNCDPEETSAELYTDLTTIEPPKPSLSSNYKARYNITIFANVEYSCVVFRVFPDLRFDANRLFKPKIRLRRWCLSPDPICYDFQLLQIDFAVEIEFRNTVTYKVMAYGKEVYVIDTKKFMTYTNSKESYPRITHRY